MSSILMRSKRLLVGRPLASERLEEQKLSKTTALAVLSSDAISSVAYATEQILFVLAVLPGVVASSYVFPISVVIVALLVLVGLSYRQTIFAYPGGGGSFTVARDNLGVGAGLVAAAALLTDYVLTVSVSIASGVAAIVSAYPGLTEYRISMCIAAILLLMLVNLRGVRESGAAFSLPTYVFIAMMLALIGVGLYRLSIGHELAPVSGVTHVDPVSVQHAAVGMPVAFAFLYLMMRGFAEGCSAMTGTEAISNGITAFRAPAPRNAAKTLGWMVTILAVFFLGVSWLAQEYAVMPTMRETVLSQLGRHIFGMGKVYYIFQYATFAILVLAANTAFADFPRLSSILASEKFLPRQLAARGDRLAFSNGIVALALVAILLVWIFRAQTTALIPLYAIGVFVCFTLSQAGMVRHWFTVRESGWKWKAALNGLGALATGIVSIVQVATKFTSGAWIVVVLIPLIILLLRAIHEHYRKFADEVKFVGHSPIVPLHHTVVVPINAVTKATAGALVYATMISADVRATYIDLDSAATAKLRADWDAWDIGVELVIVPSPYRSVLRPLVDYVENLRRDAPGELVTVVVPEIVPRHWWEHFLHNKTALYIRTAFLFKPNVVVTAVPFHLGNAVRLRDRFDYDEQLDESLDEDVRMTREMLLMETESTAPVEKPKPV
jgi:amino acid transporter